MGNTKNKILAISAYTLIALIILYQSHEFLLLVLICATLVIGAYEITIFILKKLGIIKKETIRRKLNDSKRSSSNR